MLYIFFQYLYFTDNLGDSAASGGMVHAPLQRVPISRRHAFGSIAGVSAPRFSSIALPDPTFRYAHAGLLRLGLSEAKPSVLTRADIEHVPKGQPHNNPIQGRRPQCGVMMHP